jgi:butyrate response factor 1
MSLPRHPLHLIKTEMCRFAERCRKRDCTFAHTRSELREKIPEEQYCRSWAMNGTCPFGENCRFRQGHTNIEHQSHIEKSEPIKPQEKLQEENVEINSEFCVLTNQPRNVHFIQKVVVPSCVPDMIVKFPQLDKVYPYFDYEVPLLDQVDWNCLVSFEIQQGPKLKDLLDYGTQQPELLFMVRVVIMCLTGAIIVKN